MYVDKKVLIGLVAGLVILVGLQIWSSLSARAAAADAANAVASAQTAGTACGPCRNQLTRAALGEALVPFSSNVGAVRDETAAVRDGVAKATDALQPLAELPALAHFLRFSSAYHELLLEELARRARVDLASIRSSVERMFETAGGKPKNWVWGAP